jgi:hypothetical protein
VKYAALWSQVVGLYTEGFTDAKSRPGEERHKNFVAWDYPCDDGLDFRLRKARPVLLHRVNDWHLAKFVVPLARVDLVAVFCYRRREHDPELVKHAEKISKRKWNSLKNYMSVAYKVKPSLRRDGIDYSVHRLVSPFSPEDQIWLLDRASQCAGIRGGVHDHMKRIIKDYQEIGRLPKTAKTKFAEPPQSDHKNPRECRKVIPVKFTLTHEQFLYAVVEGRGGYGPHGARRLVCKIVCDYIQQNLPTLMEDAKKHDARWGTLRPELSRILSQEKSPEVAPPPPSPAELKRQAKKKSELLAAQAAKAEEDRIAEEAGRPTRLQFQSYTGQCAKLCREVLPRAGKEAPGKLMPYMRKIFGVHDLMPETTSAALWESTLAKLESASSPEAVVEILKS